MANDYKNVISSKKAEAKKLMTDDQVVKCNVAIHTASAAAGAEAFIPIPGVDAVPITATQITMIIALGKVFDQKVSESAAKAVIGAAASTFVGRSLVKLIPIAGWAASAAVAAGVTEAIGWTAAVDFANQASKIKQASEETYSDSSTEEAMDESFTDGEDSEDVNGNDVDLNVEDDAESTDISEDEISNKSVVDTSSDLEEEDSDDESISNDFSKMFGDEDE